MAPAQKLCGGGMKHSGDITSARTAASPSCLYDRRMFGAAAITQRRHTGSKARWEEIFPGVSFLAADGVRAENRAGCL
jgi:hypothetical protein